MTSDVIYQLANIALQLAETHLDKSEAIAVMMGIAEMAGKAYEAQAGRPLDPSLIPAEREV